METEIKQEQIKLNREADVNKAISDSLNMVIGETKSFKIQDVQAHQMIRTRFSRIKSNYGKVFRTKINGNKIDVTRFEDEEHLIKSGKIIRQ